MRLADRPGPRRRRQRRGDGACGVGAELGLHTFAKLPVDILALDIGARSHLAIDGARPPIEHAFARIRQEIFTAREHRIEHFGGCSRGLAEKQRFAEPDDELDPLTSAESFWVQAAEALARMSGTMGRRSHEPFGTRWAISRRC